MLVLVTGASGYVGGRLAPRLISDGHEVRATTSRSGGDAPWWAERAEIVEMDALDADQVRAAVRGVDAVYYLIHGMGGEDFVETDRLAAENLRAAVDAEGVGRVIYLSGLVPEVPEDELSDHIASRLEVERTLAASSAVVLSLRAAVLMGSGSTSFEILRQISERLPVQTIPDWMDSDVQPIAIVDTLEALVGALTADVGTRSFDIGGPVALPYAELLELYAEIAGLVRPQVSVPLLPTALVGTLAGALTDVPNHVVEALVESLHHDMVVGESDFVEALLPPGHALLGLEESIRRSLAAQASEDPWAADPMGPLPNDPSWASGGEGRPLLARAIDAVSSLLS